MYVLGFDIGGTKSAVITALYENEKRVMFGMRPLEELAGKRYMSLNWIDAAKANEYQTGKPDNTGGGEDGTDT